MLVIFGRLRKIMTQAIFQKMRKNCFVLKMFWSGMAMDNIVKNIGKVNVQSCGIILKKTKLFL